MFVMLWTHHAAAAGITGEKAMWFFDRESIPADLAAGKPVPGAAAWGKPYALFYTDEKDCPATHFQEQQIIFDITLCGAYAGNTFSTQCPALAPANANASVVTTQAICRCASDAWV